MTEIRLNHRCESAVTEAVIAMMRKAIVVLTILSGATATYAQDKELLIIGTMHDVPAIVSRSYRPLLKFAKKYQPEAIYVEDICPDDTQSLKNFTPRLLSMADSLLRTEGIDEERFMKLKKKSLSELESADYAFLSNTYLKKRDRANYVYYNYLKTYGMAGSKKALRNENGDLIFPLAIARGITELIPVDDHKTEKEYQRAWSNTVKAGKATGDDQILAKLLKRDQHKRIWPSLWGKLGKYTNKAETLHRYYLINSCRYVTHQNEPSSVARQLWDDRNRRIADNLSKHMKASPYHKNILIIGAGHVVSLKNILQQVYPELKVKLMSEK